MELIATNTSFKSQNMENFTVLLFKETNSEIRYHIDGNEIWTCAKDWAKPLGKSESTIRTNLEEIPTKWKGVRSTDTLGGRYQN